MLPYIIHLTVDVIMKRVHDGEGWSALKWKQKAKASDSIKVHSVGWSMQC